jgi:2-dehydropantoate 2-reductase
VRFLVLGAGAVGGYFGGRLAEAGGDVTFLVRPARAALLREHGLAVASPLGDFRVSPQLATAETLAGEYDAVLLTAKHYDLSAAIAAIAPAVGAQTAVLPLLNGLVHLDRLDAAFGSERVLGGVAYVGASLQPDGSIRHHNRLSGIVFGDRANRQGIGVGPRARAIAEAFGGSKATGTASDNILLDMWEKFVFIAGMAGINCLLRGTVGEIVATEEGAALALELLGECAAVAAASGYVPRAEYHDRISGILAERGSLNNASMRHDLEAGSRTEGDAILGDMLRRARALGVATPILRVARCALEVHENRIAARG